MPPKALHESQQPLFDELLGNLDRAQLLELADLLPFDQPAALSFYNGTLALSGKTMFLYWLQGQTKDSPLPSKRATAAAYCASAATGAMAQMMTRILDVVAEVHGEKQALLKFVDRTSPDSQVRTIMPLLRACFHRSLNEPQAAPDRAEPA